MESVCHKNAKIPEELGKGKFSLFAVDVVILKEEKGRQIHSLVNGVKAMILADYAVGPNNHSVLQDWNNGASKKFLSNADKKGSTKDEVAAIFLWEQFVEQVLYED